jgi:hypothetical protein
MMWMCAALPRWTTRAWGAFAANACVSVLALLAATLALVVAVEHPDAFALAHEALAQEAPRAVVAQVGEHEARAAKRASGTRASSAQTRAQPQRASSVDCAPTADVPVSSPTQPAGEPGDYPSMPIAAAREVSATLG